MKYFIFNKPK